MSNPSTVGNNRLCLLAAFLVNVVVTAAYSSSGRFPLHLLVEALGMTLPIALPAWLWARRAKQPRVFHLVTLILSLLVALGRWNVERGRP